MRTRLFTVLASFVIGGVLAGCQMSPDYPVSSLVFDEGLIGTWRVPEGKANEGEPDNRVKEKDDAIRTGRIAIERREVEHNGERVNPPRPLIDLGLRCTPITQYRVIATWTDPEGSCKAELEGYLIGAGDKRLMGLQLVRAEYGARVYEPLWPLLVPVHVVARVEREGDSLRVRMPKGAWVVWMPMVEPMDPGMPDRSPSGATKGDKEPRGMRLASSIDRLLEHYVAIAADDGAWEQAGSERLERVRP